MICGAGTPHWKLIQIKNVNSQGQPDGHIILALGGFDPMAYNCMRCAQLRAARMIDKNRCRGLDRYIERQKEVHIRLVPAQDGLFTLILWYVAKSLFRS